MSAFNDLTCPKCKRKFGFVGDILDCPPCPHCKFQIPKSELEEDQKKLDEAEKRLFEKLGISDDSEPMFGE